MEFRGEKHRQIFQNYIRRQKHRPSAHHLAAVYLLTAYALFRAAKELLTGEPMVGLAELAERDIIRPWVLNLIFQAILLSRGEMKVGEA